MAYTETWKSLYKSGKFSIKTEKPSRTVSELAKLLQPKSRVLDLGCGNGRNAIFLAKKGHDVVAIDIVDLDFYNKLPNKLKKHIFYKKLSADKYSSKAKFSAVVMARLIQYLSKKELVLLVKKISRLLNTGGILTINYVANGGLLSKKEYDIKKFKHPVGDIVKLLNENGLKIKLLVAGESHSKYVPYSAEIEAYDIICVKR